MHALRVVLPHEIELRIREIAPIEGQLVLGERLHHEIRHPRGNTQLLLRIGFVGMHGIQLFEQSRVTGGIALEFRHPAHRQIRALDDAGEVPCCNSASASLTRSFHSAQRALSAW